MLEYSQSQIAGLESAVRYATSRREYWYGATGSHQYFTDSFLTAASNITTSIDYRIKDDTTSSDTWLTIALANFNSL